MPIPKPHPDEDKSKFMRRCMSAIEGEDRPHEQKVAICLSKWKDKANATHYKKEKKKDGRRR